MSTQRQTAETGTLSAEELFTIVLDEAECDGAQRVNLAAKVVVSR